MKEIKYTRTAREVGSGQQVKGIKTSRHMDKEERLARVYSRTPWRKLRKIVKAAGFINCVKCNGMAQMLDHIKPVQISPATAFDPRNVQPLCDPCHAWKTQSIDAPNRNPAAYRYDRSHMADMRPEGMKRWANEYVMSGLADKEIGPFGMDDPRGNAPADWVPTC